MLLLVHAEHRSSFTVGQSTSLTADPGVTSSIPARSHTLVEIDHEIISKVILLLRLFQEGLLAVTSESMCTKYWLTACPGKSQACPGKNVVM